MKKMITINSKHGFRTTIFQKLPLKNQKDKKNGNGANNQVALHINEKNKLRYTNTMALYTRIANPELDTSDRLGPNDRTMETEIEIDKQVYQD